MENYVADIVCNMCGKDINKNNLGYLDDYLKIEKRWGFGSGFDNEVHIMNICESCYKEFIKKLKINHSIGN